SPYRVGWPSLKPGQAVPIDDAAPPARPPERTGRNRPTPIVHRVGYIRPLPDGGKVLIAEPMHGDGGRRFGLGVRLRAYDGQGRQIVDPTRVDEIATMLRDDDGLNVPHPLGRRARRSELLPCLTGHAVRALELAEAALLLGRPVFIAGPTGAGKSSVARTLAYLRGQPVVEVGFTGETDKTDLSAVRRLVGG